MHFYISKIHKMNPINKNIYRKKENAIKDIHKEIMSNIDMTYSLMQRDKIKTCYCGKGFYPYRCVSLISYKETVEMNNEFSTFCDDCETKLINAIMIEDVTTEKIVNDFPNVFKSGKYYHFEAGPGWNNLIYELCFVLSKILNRFGEKKIYKDFSVEEIKDKFGMLRFVVYGIPQSMRKIISTYESKSQFICETCGADAVKEKRKSMYDQPSCGKH